MCFLDLREKKKSEASIRTGMGNSVNRDLTTRSWHASLASEDESGLINQYGYESVGSFAINGARLLSR